MAPHHYAVHVRWTGNLGAGTSDYRAYGRAHEISGEGKAAVIAGSSDPVFRGEAARYNPEELLVAALSACHMLAYLHLAAEAGIVVTGYEDDAEGTMQMEKSGAGRFVSVTLRPSVQLRDPARAGEALALHETAHDKCFIAQSVNFPVHCAAASASAG